MNTTNAAIDLKAAETSALAEYLKDCKCMLFEPDVEGAFEYAFRAGAALASTAAQPPAGWVMVPEHATPEIACAIEQEIDAQVGASGMSGCMEGNGYRMWDAALASAPKAEPERPAVQVAPEIPGIRGPRPFVPDLSTNDGAQALAKHVNVSFASIGAAPDPWLRDGSLLYRLTDALRANRDEINVTMANGSRNPAVRDAAAEKLRNMLDAAQAAPAAVAGPSDAEIDALIKDEWGEMRGAPLMRHRQFAKSILKKWGSLPAPATQAAPQPAAQQGKAAYRENWDAELGRTAMRFVDRAGDVHPGVDDAETICADFHAAMYAVIERMPHVQRMNAAQPQEAAPGVQGDAWRDHLWEVAEVLGCLPCTADEILPKARAVAEDAARWRETLMHVGAANHLGGKHFTLNTLRIMDQMSLLRGSVAQHFTKCIDASRAARSQQEGKSHG